MSQNRTSLQFAADDLHTIDAALTTLKIALADLIGLAADERRQLNKMGGESKAFCRQAVTLLTENSSVLPRWLKAIVLSPFVMLALTSCSALSGNQGEGESLASTPLAVAEPVSAPSVALQEGEYVTEKAWGKLVISERDGRPASFSLQSLTGEDICELQGEIEQGSGIATRENEKTACVIKFTPLSGRIGISTSTPDQCRQFCGSSGGFEGDYLKVSEECRTYQLDAARSTFKQLYDRKEYETASVRLSSILDQCLAVLDWEGEASIRNDLALSQHKAGLDRACLKTLEPYADDARRDDDQVIEGMPPATAERYLDIVKAARTNLRLCGSRA